MHWNLYKDSKPSSCEKCIVAYVNQGNIRIGIFTYYSESTAYWKDDYGNTVYCHGIQRWCYVDDVIRIVEHRLMDEIRSVI